MVFKAAVVAFWLLLVGLGVVYLQLCRVRLEYRIQGKQVELEQIIENVRLLEIRYNQLLSPDVLERELREFRRLGPNQFID